MFCQKCKTHLPEESTFCFQCGKRVIGQNRNNRKQAVIVVALFAAALIVLIVGLPMLKDMRRPRMAFTGDVSTPLAPSFRPTPTPKPTPYWKSETWQIETYAIALAPGQVWQHPLWVNSEWRNARLVGRFQAQGGGGNDIYACVTDGDGLMNLKNGHGCKVWYESGLVTVDTINAALPSGHSYFVLSNRFSIFANKAVTFDLRIKYERLVYP